ncbi:MAG: hypothetical protein JWM33_1821 [Caulobacteraceae bacterium]|nr:hypothetical protein [Caulobacteraceae bacterium]
MRPLSLALTAAVLTACASGGMAAPPREPQSALENVYSVRAAKSGLMVNVSSNGCTKPEDFRAEITRSGGITSVAFVRLTPDRCQSFVQGRADLKFDYDTIGLGRREAFRVANPLTAWAGPGD